MDIHHLKVFVSVYKNRSFSRASGELGLTQPTVSEHIKSLEEELETRLFDRMGRRILPTKEAELLYRRAVEITSKLDDIKGEIGRFKGEIRGTLTIGASTIPGAYIIPSPAAEFRRENPGVFFQVLIEDSRKVTDMVLSGELLLGVVGAKMGRGRLEYFPLAEDELVLAAPAGMVGKKTIAVGELPGIPFLLREEGSGTRKSMEDALLEKGFDPERMNVAGVLGSTDSVREAVKSGLGASIISRLAIREDLKAGSLEEVKVTGLSMKRDFFVVTHKKRSLPRQYLAFVEYLKKRFPA